MTTDPQIEQVVTTEPKSITMAPARTLSNQKELVYQLDPEPVFDYLLLHRALDQSTVDVIKSEEQLSERNVKLLRHLEELGNPAIELFINALRQSGQMHLASTLDVEHRIRPVHGTGYWEKQRYRGQVTISFRLVAAQVLVRKDSEEDRSPRILDINKMLTPFKAKHSYENMTLLMESENGGPRPRKILEYSYEEEEGGKRCCWCCLPFMCCSGKKKKKLKTHDPNDPRLNGAGLEKTGSNMSLNLYDVMVSVPSQPSSPIKSGSTFFKTKKLTPTAEETEGGSQLHKSNSVDRNSNHQLSEVISNNLPETENGNTVVKFDIGTEGVSVTKNKPEKSKGKSNGKKKGKSGDSYVEINNQKNDPENSVTETKEILGNKENDNPVHREGSKKDKKSKGDSKSNSSAKTSPPKSLKTGKSPPTMKRSDTYELVERWKSDGNAYENARSQFFSYFDTAVQGRIVRYFEQERSTLVLQVGVKEGMTICTICMTMKQVKKLREDYEMGLVHEDLVRCVDPQKVIDTMECCAIHLRTVIDDEDIALSYQELG